MSRSRDIALTLIRARETAKQMAKLIPEPPKLEVKPAKRTLIHTERNISIGVSKNLIDEKGEGELKDILLITDSSSYKVRVMRDGEVLYDEQYSWFRSVSQEVENIGAYPEVDSEGAETGNYILNLKNISFRRRMRVYMETPSPLVISTLHAEMLVIP